MQDATDVIYIQERFIHQVPYKCCIFAATSRTDCLLCICFNHFLINPPPPLWKRKHYSGANLVGFYYTLFSFYYIFIIILLFFILKGATDLPVDFLMLFFFFLTFFHCRYQTRSIPNVFTPPSPPCLSNTVPLCNFYLRLYIPTSHL